MEFNEDFSMGGDEKYDLEKNLHPEKSFGGMGGQFAGMSRENMEQKEKEAKALLKKEIVDAGYPVLVNSTYCSNYIAKHKKCAGCDFNPGCNRMAILIDVAKEVSYNLLQAPQHIAMYMKLMDRVKKVVIETGVKPDMSVEWTKIVNE